MIVRCPFQEKIREYIHKDYLAWWSRWILRPLLFSFDFVSLFEIFVVSLFFIRFCFFLSFFWSLCVSLSWVVNMCGAVDMSNEKGRRETKTKSNMRSNWKRWISCSPAFCKLTTVVEVCCHCHELSIVVKVYCLHQDFLFFFLNFFCFCLLLLLLFYISFYISGFYFLYLFLIKILSFFFPCLFCFFPVFFVGFLNTGFFSVLNFLFSWFFLGFPPPYFLIFCFFSFCTSLKFWFYISRFISRFHFL